MSVSENRHIDRLLAKLPAAPIDRRRAYLDPEGGTLRARPGARTQDKIRIMAAVMARLAAGDGACTEEHLRAAGFTTPEIAAWRDTAAALARSETPLHSAAPEGSASVRGLAHRKAGAA